MPKFQKLYRDRPSKTAFVALRNIDSPRVNLNQRNILSSTNQLKNALVWNNQILDSKRTTFPYFTDTNALSKLSASTSDDESLQIPESMDDDENMLLRIKLIQINSDENASDSLETTEKIREFLRSFPFAAVLPVQPLQYIPSENGVNVTFLRKKTKEKGSVDGGLFIDALPIVEEDRMIIVTARRNPEGQIVGKIFSEKIALNALVTRLEADQAELGVEIITIDKKGA